MTEASQLIADARGRLKGTLAFDEIKFRMNTGAPIEKRLIMYQTEEGIKQGVMMNYRDTEGIYVAPYTGKETLQDLRDQSKWILFTLSRGCPSHIFANVMIFGLVIFLSLVIVSYAWMHIAVYCNQ